MSKNIKKEKIEKKVISSLHPKYRTITIEMTDGTTFQTRSTIASDVLKLDIDPITHPAWTKDVNYVNTKASEVFKFNNKFKGLNFKK